MQSLRHKLRMLGSSPAFWLGGAVILAAAAANITASDSSTRQSSSKPAESSSENRKTIREGARIESASARVRQVAETLVFSLEGYESIEGLENLSLHRIFQALQDDPGHDRWTVTGQITEFRERNYLLLEKAVRASAAVATEKPGKK